MPVLCSSLMYHQPLSVNPRRLLPRGLAAAITAPCSRHLTAERQYLSVGVGGLWQGDDPSRLHGGDPASALGVVLPGGETLTEPSGVAI